MKDLGELHHFLGMQVQCSLVASLCLHLSTCSTFLLTWLIVILVSYLSTPYQAKKSPLKVGAAIHDLSESRSLDDALQYLTFTQANISYVVQQVWLHTHDLQEPHLATLKRILATITCIWVYSVHRFRLIMWCTLDWVVCPDTHKPMYHCVVFHGDNLIS
jgi:hypothetical protein